MVLAGLIAFVLGSGMPANADTALFDNFETGPNPAIWPTNISGEIVTDPLDPTNHVLNFTALGSGGDIFSLDLPAGTYDLSFDILGLCPAITQCGGYLGVDVVGNEGWLVGDGLWPSFVVLHDTGTWQHVAGQIFMPDTFHLKIEDWNQRFNPFQPFRTSPTFDSNGNNLTPFATPAPGDVYYDNIWLDRVDTPSNVVSASKVTANGIVSAAEPCSLVLLGIGLSAFVAARFKR
jgi:hypothetical protein